MTLHLIPSRPKPDAPTKSRVRAASKPADMLQCPRCHCRDVVETILGAMIVAGKLTGGGTKQIVCVGCLLKGERVVVN